MNAPDLDEVSMRNALDDIARKGCQWDRAEPDDADDNEGDCDCGPCIARRALAAQTEWRYRGALAQRQDNGLHPREARMVASLRAYMEGGTDGADVRLAKVLHEATTPTRRDWYVVASVVQWLATNVGMSVIEGAGFKYTLYDADRAEREAVLPSAIGATP